MRGDPREACDREEEEIINDMNEGRISQEEGRRALRDLRDSYWGDAEDSAREAYADEMRRW